MSKGKEILKPFTIRVTCGGDQARIEKAIDKALIEEREAQKERDIEACRGQKGTDSLPTTWEFNEGCEACAQAIEESKP